METMTSSCEGQDSRKLLWMCFYFVRPNMKKAFSCSYTLCDVTQGMVSLQACADHQPKSRFLASLGRNQVAAL